MSFRTYEACCPLYSFGTLTGYLMMGQTLEAGPDADRTPYEMALPLVTDANALEEAIAGIPVREQGTIDSLVTIMEVCAQYITLSNRMNLSKNELVSEVHSYIQKHYDQKLTIDDLCRQFFCSRASLTRKFRETYHISIHDYICQVRLENGCRLLRGTSLSIGEIAFLRLWGPKLFYPGLLPDLWDDTHAVQEKENDIIDLCFHHIPLMIPIHRFRTPQRLMTKMGFHFSFRSTAKAARNNPAPTS